MSSNYSKSIKRICKDFGLTYDDAFTQDWAYELSEDYRTYEYFQRYLKGYSTQDYGITEKMILMELILDIANELIEENQVLKEKDWKTISAYLEKDKNVHQDAINYWSLEGESLENAFALTPMIRKLRQKIT